jgi:hypothetical protein
MLHLIFHREAAAEPEALRSEGAKWEREEVLAEILLGPY